MENTLEGFAKGIVNTSSGKDKITILLVGENGTGKTSVLSLLVNVMAGRQPAEYDLEPYKAANERSGSHVGQSQTNKAEVYTFKSMNGVQITVLDTPGLADTRGILQDNEHKKNIVAAIGENIPEVTAVIILAYGTNPRLGFATDFVFTTLTAIFPNTLANNICLLFTNVASPLSWNLQSDRLPVELQKSRRFLLDNPFAMQKRLQQIKQETEKEGKIDDDTRDMLEDLETAVNAGHKAALKMLVKLFDWLDTLERKGTREIISLYEKSTTIDRNIDETLARMTQLALKKAKLEQLIRESNGIKLTVEATKNFTQESTKEMWVYQDQPFHSTICGEPQCYSNCHKNCTVPYTVDPKNLSGCASFLDSDGKHLDHCIDCKHHMDKHRHYNSIWVHQVEKKKIINSGTQKLHEDATEKLGKKQVEVGDVRKEADKIGEDMVTATEKIGQLAAEYSELALSGSFTGQVKKSVNLLETHLQGLRNKSDVDPGTIKQIEASLDQLQGKLRVLELAAEAAKSKVSTPNIVERLNQGAKNLLGLQ